MADFKADRKSIIGVGGSSVVYAGTDEKRRESVAIKSIDLNRIPVEEVAREVTVQKTVQHPNLVPLLYCGAPSEEDKERDEDELWLVMPYYKYSARGLLDQKFPEGIHDPHVLAAILHDIASALDYLHDSQIIHRDVKGGNIMFADDGKAMLTDFGISALLLRDISGKIMSRRTFTGSLAWMAPEVMEQTTGYTVKADVWSLGILALELAYGQAPYFKFPPLKVMILTLQNDAPTTDFYERPNVKLPDSFRSFVGKCLKKDTTRRPSIKKLLTHKFFKKYYKPGSTVANVLKTE